MSYIGVEKKYLEDYNWVWRFGISKSDVDEVISAKKKEEEKFPAIVNVEEVFGCAFKAYDDLRRVLHGVGEWDKPESNTYYRKCYRTNVSMLIVGSLPSLFKLELPNEYSKDAQLMFNNWHKGVCEEIQAATKNFITEKAINPVKFEFGVAQKWLNMTLKNMLALSLSEDLCAIAQYLHAPVDNKVKDKVKESNIVLKPSWSSMNYAAYETFQKELRCNLKVLGGNKVYKCPLEWEFDMFNQ